MRTRSGASSTAGCAACSRATLQKQEPIRGSAATTPVHEKGAVSNAFDDAPGRNRTCDLSLRRRTLYPLSYGRRGSLV